MVRKQKIFLVDDDIEDIEFVKEALANVNFQGDMVSFGNGKDLLSNIENFEEELLPDLIMLDLNMPLKDGFEALSDLRNNQALSDVPVVILTASSRSHDETRCYDLGCNLFLRKPIVFEDYNLVIEQALKVMKPVA